MNLKKKFVVGAASVALIASMGVAPAFAAEIYLPNGTKVERLAGPDRVETSLEAAKVRMEQSTVDTAYIVGYDAVVDAASASSLKDGVILVAPRDRGGQLLLGKAMKDDAKLANISKLVAVGGTSVVADSVLENIKKFDDSITETSRIDGKNRYETSANIAKRAFAATAVSTVFLTRGDNPVDALSAGSLNAFTDKKGPVLLVNPSGTVDKSIVDYYRSTGKPSDNVLVLGGETALSDAQVQQVVGETESISPWKFAETEESLKLKVQKAAIEYLGHKTWQGMADTLKFKTDGTPEALFGLGDANSLATEGTMKDPRKIKAEKVTDPAEAFSGFKPTLAQYDIYATKIDGAYKTAKAELNEAVANAVKAGTDANGVETLVKDKFEALYGTGSFKATTVDGASPEVKVKDQGAFNVDKDGKLTGLNKAFIAKLGKDYAQNEDAKIKEALEVKDDTQVAAPGAADPKNLEKFNEILQADFAKQKALTEASKKKLANAVATYNAKPWAKVVTQAKGVKRIIGKDRYETAALISYYATNAMTNDSVKNVYLASGEDMHLIDSVVAGQLTNGTIMLVPGADLSDETKLELARLVKQNVTIQGYVIGGPKAVSDDAVVAVAKAMGI
ncbi:cell wall-binding repeat-containing protein [Mobiluncus porci]|uniref:Cell wall-binding repeat-containing protein n=1 Tax=Mobiluncus porci TaxID=2652278 RepID=A0A7K0K1B3_9ACTO|nr:cell wall-binding repeat-containing protein [Mobiluncus porci]MST49224.1 cell wall-binding repeat-containing protein [Mobiluncus porci]